MPGIIMRVYKFQSINSLLPDRRKPT